ncbi:MAG: MBL fold metallo-hydrolase [bacterium]
MDFLKKYQRYAPLVLLGALAVFCAVVWVRVGAETPSGLLKVAVLDVGQGDAIYIESPTGEQLLIDGGPDGSLLRQLSKIMPLFDRSIDVALETHPHADHVMGFIDLFKRYSVGAFIEPGVVYKGTEVDALEQEIDDQKIPRYLARRGMVVDLGGGAVLTILWPQSDVTHIPESHVHEGNVVARLTYGKTSVLLMGDAPKDVEAKLLAEKDALAKESLKSDVLKVGHHGSRTSSGDAFIAVVHPAFAAISVGAHNMYKLPNQEPIDSLTKLGAHVFRTDQVGTILFESDGQTFWKMQ